ncbi:MAG: sugar ABC transporter permease [Cyanobacteria bacterium P01_D01_bin.50]
MTKSNIEIVISLEEPNLDEEELQEEVENLLPQIKEVDGVEDAGLVEVTEAPEGSKSIGGFVLGMLKTIINPASLQILFFFLRENMGNKKIKIELKARGGKTLKLEAHGEKELEMAMQLAQDFIKNNRL